MNPLNSHNCSEVGLICLMLQIGLERFSKLLKKSDTGPVSMARFKPGFSVFNILAPSTMLLPSYKIKVFHMKKEKIYD